MGELEPAQLARVRAGEGPFSWPNISDSKSPSGTAATLTATKGASRRGLWRCTARATSSLPVPLSPVTSTVACVCATWAICS